MISQVVQDALNQQINKEFHSSYTYLAMAAYCEEQNFLGCSHWLRIQSQEEYSHAIKIYNFMIARRCNVKLLAVDEPKGSYENVIEVFEHVLQQEVEVTLSIDSLYELAFGEKAFAALVELQWFITEQVEEERVAREVLAKFKLLKDDPAALLDLDRELGQRAGAEIVPGGQITPDTAE